jgi:hypothetical protein
MAEKDTRSPDVASSASPTASSRRHPWRKRIVLLVAVLFFGYLFFTEILDPWAGAPYIEVSHGDHMHYLPKEADLDDINVSNFPTRPPGPNETITLDGRIVPKEN